MLIITDNSQTDIVKETGTSTGTGTDTGTLIVIAMVKVIITHRVIFIVTVTVMVYNYSRRYVCAIVNNNSEQSDSHREINR